MVGDSIHTLDHCISTASLHSQSMWLLLLSLSVSFGITLAVVRSAKDFERLVGDHDLSGPQKFHARPVPRVGGIGIISGVLAATVAASSPSPRVNTARSIQAAARRRGRCCII